MYQCKNVQNDYIWTTTLKTLQPELLSDEYVDWNPRNGPSFRARLERSV